MHKYCRKKEFEKCWHVDCNDTESSCQYQHCCLLVVLANTSQQMTCTEDCKPVYESQQQANKKAFINARFQAQPMFDCISPMLISSSICHSLLDTDAKALGLVLWLSYQQCGPPVSQHCCVYYYLSKRQHASAGKSNLAPFNAKCLPMCGNEPGSIAHPCFSKHLLTPDSAHCSEAYNCFSRFCGKSIQQWLDPPPYPTPVPS